MFNCKNLGENTGLYCLSDTLQLADIWQVFTNETIKSYELDPGHYITLPSLSWDAMLKYTNVEIELISDPTLHQCIEKSIRGGISMITKRFSRANNKYLLEIYDPSKPIKHIMYLDKNNLYGHAMSQPLPVGGLRFATEEEISKIDVNNLAKGFLNVDLEYPDELHDLHNNFLCAPEHIGERNNRRLISGLNYKIGYWVHYRLLETYLRLGLKVKKINDIIFFEEKSFIKAYIEKNTKLCQESLSKIKKDVYKLKNNSVYGKTMESVPKCKNIKVLNMEDSVSVLKNIAFPTFKDITEFPGYSLGLAHHLKGDTLMNKPIFTGNTVLDLSKKVMYEFFYDYIKPKWGDKAKLLFTDTDSFRLEIETEDVYKDVSNDVDQWFDTSNYPKDHLSGITAGVNKMVP